MTENFDIYIKRISKSILKNKRTSPDSCVFVNAVIHYIVQNIMLKANSLKTVQKRLSAREIMLATRLMFTGEIRKHAVVEAFKSVNAYTGKKNPSSNTNRNSRTSRAKLVLSVPRVEKMMMSLSVYKSKSEIAAVYLASVVEYICAEILELAGKISDDSNLKTIQPLHLAKAIEKDGELAILFEGFTTTTLVSNKYFSSHD